MITARNYASQAETGMISWSRKCRDRGYVVDSEHCISTAFKIAESVHFALPDNGEIFDDDLKGLKGVELRLPFPSITIEYFVNEDKSQYTDETPGYSPKRLIVVSETNLDDVIERCFIGLDEKEKHEAVLSRDYIVRAMGSAVVSEIRVCNVIDYPWLSGRWMLCPLGFIIPSRWEGTGRAPTVAPLVPGKDKTVFQGIPMIVQPGMYKSIENRFGKEAALRNCLHDISGEIRAVLEMAEALSCVNISSSVLQKEGNNKAREKHGKVPIYETRELVLVSPLNRTQRQESKGGSHRSPRQHLRRGHIRKLDDTRRIWVNSCVVGSKENGVLEKKYSIISGGSV